jgi:phosphohistidine phosphatase
VSGATPRYLWLLRHAKTLRDPPPGKTDHDRRLSPRGRKDAGALGRRLGDEGDHLGLGPELPPGLILCSTATRTRQTAERVVAEMAQPPPVQLLRELYEADPQGVLDQVGLVDDAVRSVMVVGHNPTAQELALTVLAPGDKAGRKEVEHRGFPTSALAVVSLPADRWAAVARGTATLIGLFTPPY